MSVATALIRSIAERSARRVYSTLRLCLMKGAKHGWIHPTVCFSGRGTPDFGSFVVIERNVRLNTAKHGTLRLSKNCRIGESSVITVANEGVFSMGEGAGIGSNTTLLIASEWKMGPRSNIASGCEIFAREKVTTPGRLIIGNGSRIGDHSLIDMTGDVTMEDNSTIGPHSILYTHNHRYQEADGAAWHAPLVIKPIIIREGAWVGARVTILPGVIIGKNAVIAAGSVVVKAVPDNAVYGGVPAKALHTR